MTVWRRWRNPGWDSVVLSSHRGYLASYLFITNSWPNPQLTKLPRKRADLVALTVNCYFWKLFSRRKICQDKNSVNPLNGEQVKIRSAAYLFYEVVRIWRLDRLQPISVRVSNRPTTDSFQLLTVGLKISNLQYLRLKQSSHRMLKESEEWGFLCKRLQVF